MWARLVSFLLLVSFLAGVTTFVSSCATVAGPKEWITVGKTTRQEVVEQYGEPDVVLAHEGGETAIYRPRDGLKRVPIGMEVPTVQAGPGVTDITKMKPVVKGLGGRPMNGGLQGRPEQELRILYDAQGIVQEVRE
jgi:hypothetical protein